MDRVLSATFTDDYSDQLRLAYCDLSKDVVGVGEKTIELIVKNTKALLLSSKTRYRGLLLLSHSLSRLNNEIFSENCSILLQTLAKVLQESKSSDERILAYKVLTQIFSKIYIVNSQSLTRDLSSCMNTLIVQCFFDIKLSDTYYAVNCLSACASAFPSTVSAKRAFLESKILEAVFAIADSDDDLDTLKCLGFCYAKIAIAGAGASNLSKYRESFSKILNTFVQFLGLFDVFPSKQKPLLLFHFENNQILPGFYRQVCDIFVDPLKNIRRLCFLTYAICGMITGQHLTMVPLPVEAILEILSHFTLFSNANIKDNHAIEILSIGYVLPLIQENMFIILSALLTICQQNMILFVKQVNGIILTTFDWLDKVNATERRLYLNLRSSVYAFVQIYFTTLGEKTCFLNSELQSIIKLLLENIKILDHNLTVLTTKNSGISTGNHLNQPAIIDKDSLIKITLNSIKAIRNILGSFNFKLDIVSYNLIQNEVIFTILHIYRNWLNLSFPYKDDLCRRGLIELLQSLLMNVPTGCNAPLETAIVIFEHANRLEKSPLICSFLDNCFQLVNMIMSSRVAFNDCTNIMTHASRILENGMLENANSPAAEYSESSRLTTKIVPINDSENSNYDDDLYAPTKPLTKITTICDENQQATSMQKANNGSKRKLDSVDSSISITLDTATQDNKKGEANNQEADDIIFEGVFNNPKVFTEAKSTTISLEEDITFEAIQKPDPPISSLYAASGEQAIGSDIRNESSFETSDDAEAVLKDFVVD